MKAKYPHRGTNAEYPPGVTIPKNKRPDGCACEQCWYRDDIADVCAPAFRAVLARAGSRRQDILNARGAIDILVPCVVGADGTWAVAGVSKVDRASNEATAEGDYFDAVDDPGQPKRVFFIRVTVERPQQEPTETVDGEVHER